MAIEEMELALQHIRDKPYTLGKDKDVLVTGLSTIAQWYTNLDRHEIATEKLGGAIEPHPEYYTGHCKLLKLLVDHGQINEALAHVWGLAGKPISQGKLYRLEDLLLGFVVASKDPRSYFETLFTATKNDELFEVVLKSMENATTFTEQDKQTFKVIALLLCRGVGRTRHTKDESRIESAAKLWKDSCIKGSSTNSHDAYSTTKKATSCVVNYHFTQAMKARTINQGPGSYIDVFQYLISSAHTFYRVSDGLRYTLAAFYSLSAEEHKARQLLLRDMKSALELLSDDDLSNDWQGFEMIAKVSLHAGSDLVALSAYPLLGPADRDFSKEEELDSARSIAKTAVGKISKSATSKQSLPDTNHTSEPEIGDLKGNIYDKCDGGCGHSWTYADDFCCCRVCADVHLEIGCLKKLKNDHLTQFVCSPDHDWLYIPPWSTEEYRSVGKGKVRVDRELVEGKRV
ncbi:MAG: hypothetical protein MMC23_003057 [Stictis urceolatum]|nr:hypothetical protein [Stictis urceolata]